MVGQTISHYKIIDKLGQGDLNVRKCIVLVVAPDETEFLAKLRDESSLLPCFQTLSGKVVNASKPSTSLKRFV